MEMNTDNPRYPHTCTIYRITGGTQFKGGEKTILYEGKCRKESNTSIRNFYKENVPRTDHRVSMPGFGYGILPGDMMDLLGYEGILILESNDSSFYGGKTEVFFNIPKN